MDLSQPNDVLIVGAGLAGLSAAVALSGAGLRVQVLERKAFVGGRAYSYPHPALGEVIDSQHLTLGCCTNLIDLCRQGGLSERLHWYSRYNFLEPAAESGGAPRVSTLEPGPLPTPLQNTGSFLTMPMLRMRDKVKLARGMMQFLRGAPQEDTDSFAAWLERTGQTERAVRHFWDPVVLAALNDSLDRCSTRYAAKVFYEALLKNREGGRIGFPMQPLTEFFAPLLQVAEVKGAAIAWRTSVVSLRREGGEWHVASADGREFRASHVILALPFEQVRTVVESFATDEPARAELLGCMSQFHHAPITGVHLWFDRAVTDLHHAALLDTRIQWFFNKTLIRGGTGDAPQYLELAISGSFAELKESREIILQRSIAELQRFLPRMRTANIVKTGVLKEARATFSVLPGLDAFRPAQQTSSPGLFVAGDWTRTDWPSTMEGAVRSGRLAAGAVTASLGSARQFIVPDLAAGKLVRVLAALLR